MATISSQASIETGRLPTWSGTAPHRARPVVLGDEPIAFLKRPDWSAPGCQEYGASAKGNDALAQAAAIAGPDGERVLRDFLCREFSPGIPESTVERVIDGSLRRRLS